MAKIGEVQEVLIPSMVAERHVQKCHQIRSDLKLQLAAAYDGPDRQKQRKLMNGYFKNDKVKKSVLHKPEIRLPSIDKWNAEALRFNPFAPNEETLEWWYEPKRSGGARVVCDLAPRLMATHYMIADVIWAQMVAPAFIYNLKGRGRERLITDLIAKLAQGYSHYRVYDVKNCHPSVSLEAIQSLKLPWRIIENALNLDNIHKRRNPDRETRFINGIPFGDTINAIDEVDGPTGICQGSPASTLILANLLQTTPQPEQDAGYKFLYGDDLIVVERSQEICDRIDNRLRSFFCEPAIGPFNLLLKHSGQNGAFDYLGYEIRHNAISGKWDLSLSLANWMKIVKKYRDELVHLTVKHPHGIFPSAPLEPARKTLQGFPSLPDPANYLLLIQECGPDKLELAEAVKKLK